MEFIIIPLIAFLTSVVSGMLGLGGSVLLIPAYLYLPHLFGLSRMDIKLISGMTSLQVFAASAYGMFLHKKRGAVDTRLIWTMGIPITFASFSGAALSGMVPSGVILIVFAVLTVTGALLMLFQKSGDEAGRGTPDFSRITAVLISVFVGFFGGMAGAPGAFILSPLMMVILKIPTRITIGSTLGIVLLSAFSAGLGKLLTGQVPLMLSFAAIIASLPGVYLGTRLSHILKSKTLRLILAILIGAVGLQMGYSIILK